MESPTVQGFPAGPILIYIRGYVDDNRLPHWVM